MNFTMVNSNKIVPILKGISEIYCASFSTTLALFELFSYPSQFFYL